MGGRLKPGDDSGRGVIDKAPAPAGSGQLLAAALHSDRLYFRAGARWTEQEGFALATMPGFEGIAAGNVGFLERWPRTGTALSARIQDIEALFGAAGAARVRFYAPALSRGVHRQVTGLGYEAREERAFAFRTTPSSERGRVTLEPVMSDVDWVEKQNLQRTAERPPDGYACAPDDWVALERCKASRSNLRFCLFREEGTAVAAAAFLPVSPQVIRFKNLFVRAAARRRGIAREVLRTALGYVFDSGAEYMVLLAIAGSPGERLYVAAGGRMLGSVYEYSKAMEP